MISFSDWGRKKEQKDKNTDYEIVKSRSGLPMFIIEPPESLNDLPPDDEPVKKNKSLPKIVRRVCDYISVHNN